jgi:hypothetical protein
LVPDIALDEPAFRGEGITMPGRQVVEDRDVVAFLQEKFDDNGTDIAGTARDAEFHGFAFLVWRSARFR